MVGGRVSRRIIVLGVVLLLTSIGLFGLVRAQQTEIHLDEGDEVTFSCPTGLSVDFEDQGGATVSCAAEASYDSDAAMTDDTSAEP